MVSALGYYAGGLGFDSNSRQSVFIQSFATKGNGKAASDVLKRPLYLAVQNCH